MLVNFLHPSLQPMLQSSTIASEGFELSNLISTDQQLFQKGFLAERFISGPVTIRIKFTCPINIKHVLIWPQVGNQKSSGIELSLLNDDNVGKRFAASTIPSDKHGILFHQEGSRMDTFIFSPEVKSFSHSSFFRSRIYENVENMQVKIFKSHFIPAIKKIEVWGEPHRSCDADTKNRVASLWSTAQCSVIAREDIGASNINDAKHEYVPQSSDLEIPDEFYDEITHDLMTLPMILPSGKIVDYCTLEKFQAEEAKWGRLPSDPFTGVIFTNRSKPVVATALKSNIDLFLIKYSDVTKLKYVPRRLGSQNEKFDSLQLRISKIVAPSNSKRKLDEFDDTVGSKIRKINSVVAENTSSINATSSDDGLNKLLERTLHNLPSFITAGPSVGKDSILKCNQCCILMNLYRLPCSHILCRLCLNKNENQCTDCEIKFSSGEILKIHRDRSYNRL